MSKTSGESRKRIPNPLSKEDRARDAVLALRDYEAAKKAELEKTARLRALRLAREAAGTAEPPAPPAKPQRPAATQRRTKKSAK